MYIPDFTNIQSLFPMLFRMNLPEVHKHYDPSKLGAINVIAIGWLGDSVENIGATPDKCIDRLFKYYSSSIIDDGSMGFHSCEICSGSESWYKNDRPGPRIEWRNEEKWLYGQGHYLILYENDIYICPALILHYILHHDYCPPEKFITAVAKGRFISSDEYEDIFYKLPKNDE